MLFTKKLRLRLGRRVVGITSGVIALAMGAWLLAGPAVPVTAAAATAEGFRAAAGQTLVPGMLAAVRQHQGVAEVLPASTDTAAELVGVVTAADDAALVTNAAAAVPVATTGSIRALVSDLAGPIRAGDAITASPLQGIGMKAAGSVRVVGVASAGFDRSAAGEWRVLRGRDGQTTRVRVGVILLRLQVTDYLPPPEDTVIPAFLQQFSNQLAGRSVAAWRVMAGLAVSLAALVAVGSILFSAIKSGMIAMGRNPLAAKHIYRGVWRAFGISAVVLGMAIGATYCIMKL